MTEISVTIPEVETAPEPAAVIVAETPETTPVELLLDMQRQITEANARAEEALTMARQAEATAEVASEIALTEPEPEPVIVETPDEPVETVPDEPPHREHWFHREIGAQQ